MQCPKTSPNQLDNGWTRRNEECTNAHHARWNTWQCASHVQSPPRPSEGWVYPVLWRKVAGFSRCLIRSALIRWYQDQDLFISNRKSMMLHVFMQSRLKRAKTVALLDSGVTENFINISYMCKINLPIWWLTQERRLFNINGTLNKAGSLKYYTDIKTRTGIKWMRLRYFLTDLGDNQVIVEYP